MQPNILVFMTDHQRGDCAPPYIRAKTPNLKRLAETGVVFSNAYCTAPHCCPSRASFFTGLFPSMHNVWHNIDVGNAISRGPFDHVKIFTDFMEDYSLYYNGKWHVSNFESPKDKGFITELPSYKGKVKNEPVTGEWEQYQAKFSFSNQQGEIQNDGYPPYRLYGSSENPFGDEDTINRALEVMESYEKDKPFFHFIGVLGPHDPYFVPQRFIDMYDMEEIEIPQSYYDDMKDKPGLYQRSKQIYQGLDEKEVKEGIRHFLAFCSYEDYLFGKILDAAPENTIVIYTSDHGDYCGEHGMFTKGLPNFKGAYHIPLIVGNVKNRGVVDEFVSIVDFFPTILELAGYEIPKNTGLSLVPFLNGERPLQWRDAVYTQSNGNEIYGMQRSVRTKKWKFTYNAFDNVDELYDLEVDPDEMKNLAGKEEFESVVREMYQKIWRFAYENQDTSIVPYIMVRLARYGPGVCFED